MKKGEEVARDSTPLLDLRKITKVFPGVTALDQVDLSILQGEVHVLLGENGAGKSTLIKVVAGAELPNSGDVIWDGKMVQIPNIQASQRLGIAVIYQELSSVPCLSIAENMFMGRELKSKVPGCINWSEQRRRAREAMRLVGMELNPDTLMETLSVGKRQLIEIAKAVAADARLIIMDEPTSSLSRKEIDELLNLMNILKSKGKSILFITHKLDEAKKVGDTVTVLKDGHKIRTLPMSEVNEDEIISMMVGRDLGEKYPTRSIKPMSEVAIAVKRLTSDKFREISFCIHKGELLGIFGLVGAGRTEVARAMVGIDPLHYGEIMIAGKTVDISSPEHAIEHGLVLLTENRKEEGLILIHDVVENATLPTLGKFKGKNHLLDNGKRAAATDEHVSRVSLRPHDLKRETLYFSGGNQQKIVIAKWLLSDADVFIFDEPTRGIDVGAKTEIYMLMNELLGQGKTIIMISSEMQEIIGMSDKVLVMYEGHITGAFTEDDAKNQEKILIAATGGTK